MIGGTNVVSCNYSISDDGQFVAYEVCTNIAGGPSPRGIVLRYSLQTGLTDIINTNANVPQLSFELVHDLSMTPDGRFVAYVARKFHDQVPFIVGTRKPELTRWSVPYVQHHSGHRHLRFAGDLVEWAVRRLHQYRHQCGHQYFGRILPCLSARFQAGATQLIDADTNGVGVGVDPTSRSFNER